jgi:hypothetical protein
MNIHVNKTDEPMKPCRKTYIYIYMHTYIYIHIHIHIILSDGAVIACSDTYWAVPYRGGGGPVYVSRHDNYGTCCFFFFFFRSVYFIRVSICLYMYVYWEYEVFHTYVYVHIHSYLQLCMY